MHNLTLGVLDQSPVSHGMSRGDAARHSIALARAADRLGYSRYWVAEHHGTSMLAGTSPEILIALIAAATERIRVGSGGIMLPHYSPLKVAENFSLLSELAPGRIDLAVGRASGSDPLTGFALQRDRRHPAPDDFPEQLIELLAYVRDGMAAGHPLTRVAELLSHSSRPDAWLLGSSPQSGVWASELGLPYAFADFINARGAETARRYREQFTPSPACPEPRVLVAVWALAAGSDEEAERLAASSRVAFLHFLQGAAIPFPPVDSAAAYLREHPDALEAFARHRRAIVGSPARVADGLRAVADEYAADEVMVVTITFDPADRTRSYERLAREFAL